MTCILGYMDLRGVLSLLRGIEIGADTSSRFAANTVYPVKQA